MERLMKLGCVSLLSLLLSACVLIIGEVEDEPHVQEYMIDGDGEELVFNAPATYSFLVLGDHNKVTLKGNISKILITGSYNSVTIVEDAYLDTLVVEGDANDLDAENDLALFVEDIELTGDNNLVVIDSYGNMWDSGNDNQLLLKSSSGPN